LARQHGLRARNRRSANWRGEARDLSAIADAEPWPLVNPEITWRSEEKIVVWDACLSFLSIFMQVERHRE